MKKVCSQQFLLYLCFFTYIDIRGIEASSVVFYTGCRNMMYLVITNVPFLKILVLSDSRKAKLYSRILVVVLRGLSHVENKINRPAQI